MKESFSLSVKRALAETEVKKDCCKKAMLYGMLWSAKSIDSKGITLSFDCEEALSLCERLICEAFGFEYSVEYKGNGFRLVIGDPFVLGSLIEEFGNFSSLNGKAFRCDGCKNHFLRGVFISSGSVNSPDAEYHLEFRLKRSLDELLPMFAILDISPSFTKRGTDFVMYLKNGEEISDFLAYIGAKNAAFSLINEKIRREIRQNANRQKNFDTANIKKSIKANEEQLEAIRFLISENHLGSLNKSMQETVILRNDNPSLSLAELATIHNPPITKSGLTHRLQKIKEKANELKESKK